MRYVLPACLLVASAMPVQAGAGDIPLVAIGLPFAPETPMPVASTHPLYQSLEVAEIEGLPSAVGSSRLNWIKAARRSSINAALRDSFQRMNMLAPKDKPARGRLTVSWIANKTPFRLGGHNTSAATLHYRLVRIDNGHVLFDREITTSARGDGGDASMRDNGIARAAIATNFASAAWCLDHAARGKPVADCALTPKFEVTQVRIGH